jgi:hypothetical protein
MKYLALAESILFSKCSACLFSENWNSSSTVTFLSYSTAIFAEIPIIFMG